MTIEQALYNFKEELNKEMILSIRNAYNEWSKTPIDTGNMRDNTNLIGVNINIENLSILTAIDTPEYAKYVRFPESESNPNFKYGPRDFIRSALQRPNVVEARNTLMNLMVQKYLEMDDLVGIRNIKIKL